MIIKRIILTCLIFLSISTFAIQSPSIEQQQIQFAVGFSKQYHIPIQQVERVLSQAALMPGIIKFMERPYESLPYDNYIKHFLDKKRINAGAKFWEQNGTTLALAQKTYGVDPSVIVAIIGVESYYGKQAGTYPVLNTLYTLSFDYPPRAKFFSHELGQYLLMCREQHLSPLAVKGSYAGAFGMSQFMPSSYRAYGVDYSHNHQVDLMHNKGDVIMSIANFLAKSGWKRNQAIAGKFYVDNGVNLTPFLSSNAAPTTTVDKLAQNHIYTIAPISHTQIASIIRLNMASNIPEYWTAYPNLAAIMRYNHSVNYAMTVYQLATAIKQAHDKHT